MLIIGVAYGCFCFYCSHTIPYDENRMQRYNKNLGCANFQIQKASFFKTPAMMEGLERWNWDEKCKKHEKNLHNSEKSSTFAVRNEKRCFFVGMFAAFVWGLQHLIINCGICLSIAEESTFWFRLERWPSGRWRRTRNAVNGWPFLGFESLSFRKVDEGRSGSNGMHLHPVDCISPSPN